MNRNWHYHLVQFLMKIKVVKEYDPPTGMWCRMCGGSCDLWYCGMEEP